MNAEHCGVSVSEVAMQRHNVVALLSRWFELEETCTVVQLINSVHLK